MTSFIADVERFINEKVLPNFDNIPNERKDNLRKVISFIQDEKDNECVQLLFVCTHNSRRSQFTQVWTKIASDFYNIENIHSYSCGTEVTACDKRTIEALKRNGIQVKVEMEDTLNPVYHLNYSNEKEEIICYSKLYKDEKNPQKNFASIMTCSHADNNCPYLPGAKVRIPLRYNDPKEYDGTELEQEKYNETSLIIATELFYIFSQL